MDGGRSPKGRRIDLVADEREAHAGVCCTGQGGARPDAVTRPPAADHPSWQQVNLYAQRLPRPTLSTPCALLYISTRHWSC